MAWTHSEPGPAAKWGVGMTIKLVMMAVMYGVIVLASFFTARRKAESLPPT
jgi:hypothetical protein